MSVQFQHVLASIRDVEKHAGVLSGAVKLLCVLRFTTTLGPMKSL